MPSTSMSKTQPDYWLSMSHPGGEERVFPILQPVTTVGQSTSCSIRISLPRIRELHCELHRYPHSLLLLITPPPHLADEDGDWAEVYLNGVPVSSSGCPLHDRDQLEIGSATFTVHAPAVQAAVSPEAGHRSAVGRTS